MTEALFVILLFATVAAMFATVWMLINGVRPGKMIAALLGLNFAAYLACVLVLAGAGGWAEVGDAVLRVMRFCPQIVLAPLLVAAYFALHRRHYARISLVVALLVTFHLGNMVSMFVLLRNH